MIEPSELQNLLDEFILLPAETEWIEFKEAKDSFDSDKLGKYFSALSNEANLKHQKSAWLIFGVTDKPPRQIIGTQYKSSRQSLDSLKKEIADNTSNRLTFEEIYELSLPTGRVLMFQIPAALRGMPTSWKGHHYGRDGESLSALNINEQEQIRGQTVREDWTGQTCIGASLADLDPNAIEFAREQYKAKHGGQVDEVNHWDDATFLNKAKVCIGGRITNTAIILLGKNEATHLISPAIANITWILKDSVGTEKDYKHFGPPIILAVDQLYSRIRNLTYRYIPDQSLFPHEVPQYEPWVIRETLHNCIAHQDYSKSGRIIVVEEPDSLLFTNLGNFLPGSVEQVINRDSPPEHYRNSFLVSAMVNLNMIDTIGSGIKRMFTVQRQRFFPMPDYDLSDPERVQVRLFGKVLDENYTRVLIESKNLNLTDVIALDKVQKKRPLSGEEFKRLKSKKLIEGRRPNLFVSANVAEVTGDRAEYIKHRAFDKQHYKDLVTSYLEKFGEAKREDLEKLLLDKISDALTVDQKRNRVKNILQEMRRKSLISPKGVGKSALWHLSKP